ncbi:MAG: hypothetical protein ABII75_02485 [Candidatus Omnitrophota bacterium]
MNKNQHIFVLKNKPEAGGFSIFNSKFWENSHKNTGLLKTYLLNMFIYSKLQQKNF